MIIEKTLKYKDIETYRKLKNICSNENKKKIKLGDTTENLMKSDSYCRSNGRIKQKKWK